MSDGERIAYWRNHHGMTLRDLALKVGIGYGFLDRIEHDEDPVPAKRRETFERLLPGLALGATDRKTSGSRGIDWTGQPFGRVSDSVLARRLGVTKGTVQRARRRAGKAAYPYHRVARKIAALKRSVESLAIVAARHGVVVRLVVEGVE